MIKTIMSNTWDSKEGGNHKCQICGSQWRDEIFKVVIEEEPVKQKHFICQGCYRVPFGTPAAEPSLQEINSEIENLGRIVNTYRRMLEIRQKEYNALQAQSPDREKFVKHVLEQLAKYDPLQAHIASLYPKKHGSANSVFHVETTISSAVCYKCKTEKKEAVFKMVDEQIEGRPGFQHRYSICVGCYEPSEFFTSENDQWSTIDRALTEIDALNQILCILRNKFKYYDSECEKLKEQTSDNGDKALSVLREWGTRMESVDSERRLSLYSSMEKYRRLWPLL
jgi:hypothetical protein